MTISWRAAAPSAVGSSGYTNFSSSNVSFFNQYPNGGTHHTLDTLATQAINDIYSWDVEHFQGVGGQGGIGSNPLHPSVGCT